MSSPKDTGNHSPRPQSPILTSPTYSNWEWRNGAHLPREDKSPSPPYSPSPSYVETEIRIIAARAQRDQSLAIQQPHHDRALLAAEITYRQNWYTTNKEALTYDKTYRWLRPLRQDLRLRMAPFPHLLDAYYGVELLVGTNIQERIEYWARERQTWETESEFAKDEAAMLQEIEAAREDDVREGNDFLVLSEFLDQVEEMLEKDLEMGERDKEMRFKEGGLITELPQNIRKAVALNTVLDARLGSLRNKEVETFPFRCESFKAAEDPDMPDPLQAGKQKEFYEFKKKKENDQENKKGDTKKWW